MACIFLKSLVTNKGKPWVFPTDNALFLAAKQTLDDAATKTQLSDCAACLGTTDNAQTLLFNLINCLKGSEPNPAWIWVRLILGVLFVLLWLAAFTTMIVLNNHKTVGIMLLIGFIFLICVWLISEFAIRDRMNEMLYS